MRVLVSLLACAATASSFLLPTPTTRPASALFASTVGAKDIVDTAVDAGSFKTLATALTAAGYVSRRRKTRVSVWRAAKDV